MLLREEAFDGAVEAFRRVSRQPPPTDTDFHLAYTRILQGSLADVARTVRREWDLSAPLRHVAPRPGEPAPSVVLAQSMMAVEWLFMAGHTEDARRQKAAITRQACAVDPESARLCPLVGVLEREIEAHLALLAGDAPKALHLLSDVESEVHGRLRRSLWLVVGTWLDGKMDPGALGLDTRLSAWECATAVRCPNAAGPHELHWLRAVAAEALQKSDAACGWWREVEASRRWAGATERMARLIDDRVRRCRAKG